MWKLKFKTVAFAAAVRLVETTPNGTSRSIIIIGRAKSNFKIIFYSLYYHDETSLSVIAQFYFILPKSRPGASAPVAP